MSAILFGSISSLADTSELQRAAFNQAFADHGLDWAWDRAEYQDLLVTNGGKQRIADYAAARGEEVDAEAVHQSKSEHYRRTLANVPVLPRPGVADTIKAAHAAGWRVGLVTTTSRANVDALLESLTGRLDRDDLDITLAFEDVNAPKPDGAVYTAALDKLEEDAANCIAIEDNLGGVAAAKDAGLTCVVFANENTSGHEFSDGPRSMHLDFAALASLVDAS